MEFSCLLGQEGCEDLWAGSSLQAVGGLSVGAQVPVASML